MSGSKENKEVKTEGDSPEEPPIKREPFFVYERYVQRDGKLPAIDDIDKVKLSSEHKVLIRESWNQMAMHMAENGARVFIRIFEVSKNIQKVFKLDGLTRAQMMKHPILAKHSIQFMESLEFAVSNLDQIEELVAPVFTNLGKHHIRFTGLKDEYFGIFTGAMMYVWKDNLKEEFTPDVRSAWSRLLDYLIQHIQFGWHLALEAADKK